MSGTRPQKTYGSFKLSNLFRQAVAEEARELEDTGTAAVLRHLSLAVQELQQAGIDVRMDLRAGDYSAAYDMVFGTAKKNATAAVYGFLHIGPMTRLFAIAGKMDEENVAKLFISEHNVSEASGRAEWEDAQKVPAVVLHFDEDTDALLDFQKYIVHQAAVYAAAMQNDPAGVFNNPVPTPEKLDKRPTLGAGLRPKTQPR